MRERREWGASDGDVVVVCEELAGFTVYDARTGEVLAGPFARSEYATGVAHSIAWKRGAARVWRQHGDRIVRVGVAP
jgi:hypothetical protein